MADVRCPMCGKPNPQGLDICQHCGARLTPLTPSTPDESQPIHAGEKPTKKQTSEFEKVKFADSGPIHAGEVPTRKDTGELERALPSWLKSVRGDAEKAPAESPPDASPAQDLPVKSPPDLPVDASGDSLDWLAGLGSAASEEEEEVPDWLAGLRSEQDVPAVLPEPLVSSEPEQALPEEDWMSRLGGVGEQPAAPAPDLLSSEALPPAEGFPDWLESLKSKASTSEELSGSADETSDWLSGRPETPAETTSAAPDSEPDWLSKLKVKTDEPEEPQAQSTPQAQPTPQAESPDWLSNLTLEAGVAASSVFSDEVPPPSDSPAEVPDWLSQLQSDVKAASEAEKQAEEFEPATGLPAAEKKEQKLPDWLSGVESSSAPAAGAPALVLADAGESDAEPGQTAFSLETPDWLSKLRPDRGPDAPPPEEEETEPGDLEAAELPSWVQAMRPVESVVAEVRPAAPDEDGTVEGSGPLAGLRGVLPSGLGQGSMRKPPAYAIKLQVTDNQQRYAAQLEKMILNEGLAGGSKAPRRVSNLVLRLVVSIVLIAATLIPLVAGQQFTPDMKLFPSEWANTSILLNQFSADTPMLVVFDYDPAFSGELEASAAAAIDQILFLGTRLTLVSTTPTGPALAEQFLKSTQAYHLETGMQYTNLGYLAGGPAGVLSFAMDPVAAAQLTVQGNLAWETPALQGVTRLSDFAAIIILTDNADTGRVWIEQTRAAIDNTPILMIISAQAEPMIRPYYDSGQIQGLVTGLAGGKAYEQSYAVPGLARRYWDSFGLGTLSAVVMIAIGCAWSAVQAWRTRKNPGEEA